MECGVEMVGSEFRVVRGENEGKEIRGDWSFSLPTRLPSFFSSFILRHEEFLQFDWLRAVVFQLNLKYLHVKITNLF